MGDARYRRIKSNLTEALQHSFVATRLEEVMDLESILGYKVSSVPAILVEDKILFEYGDIPSAEQLEAMLLTALVNEVEPVNEGGEQLANLTN